MSDYKYIGKLSETIIGLLDFSVPTQLVYQHQIGLFKHVNRRHSESVKYLDCLSEILYHPDYVGKGSDKVNDSIELVKKFEDNILMALKLHISGDFYYIASVYPITDVKVSNRLYSGRLKRIDKQSD